MSSIVLYQLGDRLVALDDRFEPSIRYVKEWLPVRWCPMTGHEFPAGEYSIQYTAIPVKDIFTGKRFTVNESELTCLCSWYGNDIVEEEEDSDDG